LLANHGAVTYDADPFTAYYHLERLEHFAGILLIARLLGKVQVMTGDQVGRLLAATGQGGTSPPCVVGSPEGAPPEAPHAAAPEAPHPVATEAPHPVATSGERGSAWSDHDFVDLITREVRRALAEEGHAHGPGTHR
jgi:hypothetical protein